MSSNSLLLWLKKKVLESVHLFVACCKCIKATQPHRVPGRNTPICSDSRERMKILLRAESPKGLHFLLADLFLSEALGQPYFLIFTYLFAKVVMHVARDLRHLLGALGKLIIQSFILLYASYMQILIPDKERTSCFFASSSLLTKSYSNTLAFMACYHLLVDFIKVII